MLCGELHISDVCLTHFCLLKVKLFSYWPHGYSKDVRAPSQIYKWEPHNEYDDTQQKYSSVSSGNSHNLICSVLLWQTHHKERPLCKRDLKSPLVKTGKLMWERHPLSPAQQRSRFPKRCYAVMLHLSTLLWRRLNHFLPCDWGDGSHVFTWIPITYKGVALRLSLTSDPWSQGGENKSYHHHRSQTVPLWL